MCVCADDEHFFDSLLVYFVCGCFVFASCVPFLRLRHSRLFISNFISYEFVCFYRAAHLPQTKAAKRMESKQQAAILPHGLLHATPHRATHPLAKKKKKRVYIGRDLFCRQGKVIYISNNESDCRPGSFAPVCLRFGPGTFKFKYFRLCPDLLFQKAAIPTFPPPNFGFTPQQRTAFICLDLSTKVIKI